MRLLFGNLIHRMIFWELLRVFLVALTSLTGLFLIGLVVQQANQLGLSLAQTLAAVPLLVPVTLPYTIPATTLFASCVVYGRLSKDNEAVALKAAGVDLLTVLRPAVLLGLLTAGVTFALAHTVIPRTQVLLQQQLLKDPEEVLYNLLKRDRIYRSGGFPYVLHVKDVQGRRLVDVVVKRRKLVKDAAGNLLASPETYDFVVRAREARLRVELPTDERPDVVPTLYIDPDRWSGAGDGIVFLGGATEPIGVPLPDMFSPKDLKDRSVNLLWHELPPKAAEFRAKLSELDGQLRQAEDGMATAPSPAVREGFRKHIDGLRALTDHYRRQLRNTECEYWMRPALALGCLVFAVIGCPVGMWANRADYLSSFITCFLPTVFVYYPLLLAGSNMGRDGKLPMPAGVLLADAVGAVLTLLLVHRLIKR